MLWVSAEFAGGSHLRRAGGNPEKTMKITFHSSGFGHGFQESLDRNPRGHERSNLQTQEVSGLEKDFSEILAEAFRAKPVENSVNMFTQNNQVTQPASAFGTSRFQTKIQAADVKASAMLHELWA